MSIILDPEVQDEIFRLEKLGNVGLARLLRDNAEINLDAVASMADASVNPCAYSPCVN